MVSLENKYRNGKIYRICDNESTNFYYGSTVQTLAHRMGGHRADYEKYRSGNKNYITVYQLFDEYGVENCKIEWVEDYPCNSRNELVTREGYHIRNNHCVNKNVAGRTLKQYYKDNSEHILRCLKEYRHRRSDALREYRKKYREEHKEHLKLKKHEEYERNKEHKKEKARQNYMNNKDEISKRRKETITCSVCGSHHNRNDKARHERTQKHKAALTLQT
jgi:hypothetical protein